MGHFRSKHVSKILNIIIFYNMFDSFHTGTRSRNIPAVRLIMARIVACEIHALIMSAMISASQAAGTGWTPPKYATKAD